MAKKLKAHFVHQIMFLQYFEEEGGFATTNINYTSRNKLDILTEKALLYCTDTLHPEIWEILFATRYCGHLLVTIADTK